MKWSNDINLILNVDKTTDLKESVIINFSAVGQVNIHNFHGLTVVNTLPWTQNADKISKEGRQRLWFFLLTLRSCNASINVMINFHRAVVESPLTTTILVWFGRTNKREMKKIASII